MTTIWLSIAIVDVSVLMMRFGLAVVTDGIEVVDDALCLADVIAGASCPDVDPDVPAAVEEVTVGGDELVPSFNQPVRGRDVMMAVKMELELGWPSEVANTVVG